MSKVDTIWSGPLYKPTFYNGAHSSDPTIPRGALITSRLTELRHIINTPGRSRDQSTWTPKVCKIMAQSLKNSPKGNYFAYFWGPGIKELPLKKVLAQGPDELPWTVSPPRIRIRPIQPDPAHMVFLQIGGPSFFVYPDTKIPTVLGSRFGNLLFGNSHILLRLL